ncbi:hypothetical protein YC2023_110355 [Brassica napus]
MDPPDKDTDLDTLKLSGYLIRPRPIHTYMKTIYPNVKTNQSLKTCRYYISLSCSRHGNVKPRHHHHPKKPIFPFSLLFCLCFLSTEKDQKISQTKNPEVHFL